MKTILKKSPFCVWSMANTSLSVNASKILIYSPCHIGWEVNQSGVGAKSRYVVESQPGTQ